MPENKLSLFQINHEIRTIIADVISDDGEISAEAEAALSQLMQESADKVVNVGHFIARREREIKAAKEQRAAFDALVKKEQQKVDRLKALSVSIIDDFHGGIIEDGLVSVKTAKAPASVVIDDERSLPGEYIKEKITTVPDKIAIKEALKNGETVPGAHLNTSKRSFRIIGA